MDEEDGYPMVPRDRIVLEVPFKFRKAVTLDQIVVALRKPLENDTAARNITQIRGLSGTFSWDYEPCMVRVWARISGTHRWRRWRGRYGGA